MFVSEETWTQTSEYVTVVVQIGKIPMAKIDTVCTSKYLKLNYWPHIFELFFYQPIIPDSLVQTRFNSNLHLCLKKAFKNDWPDLKANLNEIEKQKIREHITEELSNLEDAKKAKRYQMKENAVEEQLKVNEKMQSALRETRRNEIKDFFDDAAPYNQTEPTERIKEDECKIKVIPAIRKSAVIKFELTKNSSPVARVSQSAKNSGRM